MTNLYQEEKTPWELEFERGKRLYIQYIIALKRFGEDKPEEAREVEGQVRVYSQMPLAVRDLGVQRKLNRLYATAMERLELIKKLWGEGGN